MKKFTETTLPNLFLNRVYQYGTRPFLYYKDSKEWKSWNWKELGERVEKVARGLAALGVKKGDHVCIMAENSPEWASFDLAILSLGAVNVPIYATTEIDQATQIIKHSDSKVMVVSTTAILDHVQNHLKSSSVKTWVCFEGGSDKCLSIEDVIAKAKLTDVSTYYQIVSSISPSDLATIVYTSGTTGEPKGVCLSHYNIVSNVLASTKVIAITADDISLSFLPLSHMFERMGGFFCMMYYGASIYYAESIEKIPENLMEVRPTILISVPRILEKFYGKVHENIETKSSFTKKLFGAALQSKNSIMRSMYNKIFFKKIQERLGGRIKFIVSGGAALTPSIARFFQQVGIPVLQGYGLTETSPVISLNKLHKNVIGSVGYVLDNLDVKTTDDGEILVKGPSIMEGYYKNEKATKEAFTEDGYFKTGDVGELHDGLLKITDRKKEIIVTSGGKKIAPQPIENELLHHPIIDQVCLVGEGMKTIGALIVPNRSYIMKTASTFQLVDDYQKLLQRKEIQDQIQDVVSQVNQRLSSYQQIKTFKLLSEPFSQENHELTPTLKLRRKNIFEHYQKDIQNLFSDSASSMAN